MFTQQKMFMIYYGIIMRSNTEVFHQAEKILQYSAEYVNTENLLKFWYVWKWSKIFSWKKYLRRSMFKNSHAHNVLNALALMVLLKGWVYK